jgi:stearoyl-CoA desaturase (Delta-9 desaturase)
MTGEALRENGFGAPPVAWPAALMFLITNLVVFVAVPWYGLAQGYHAGAILSMFALLALTGISITAGYHRLWSHRAYEAHFLVRLVFLIFGTMAIQNSVLVWSALHRRHHRSVDDSALDPYAATRGLWFSHIGWMLHTYPSGVAELGEVRDLEKDPLLRFQHDHYIPLVLATNFGIPMLLGLVIHEFWGTVLLAGFLRLVINHHCTFFINSLAHYWGTRPYSSDNSARDNGFIAFLTYGEGYHNFHHLFAHDYRNAVRWWQWDPTKWLIASLAGVGLATRLKRTPTVLIEKARIATHFERLEARIQHGRHSLKVADLEHLKARVAEEYATFLATLNEWSKLREEWVSEARERLAKGRSSFAACARKIERRLRAQRRTLARLDLALA